MTTDGFDDRRKDINTRKVIDVLKQHFDEKLDEHDAMLDAKLEEKLKGHVTWQGLAASVVGLVGLIFMVVSAFMAPIKESQQQARAEVREVKADTAAAIREVRDDIRQVSAEVRAVRSVTVDGQSRGRAQEELRKHSPSEDK